MQNHLAIFQNIQRNNAAAFKAQHGLAINTGEAFGAAIIRVLKPEWTTDNPGELVNTNGLFFSVWVDAECEAGGLARYNLHAKKLRFIKGEAFAARHFVRAFRLQAQDAVKAFPNATYPKGPITLFEGHVALTDLQVETEMLLQKFAGMADLLDRLLAE